MTTQALSLDSLRCHGYVHRSQLQCLTLLTAYVRAAGVACWEGYNTLIIMELKWSPCVIGYKIAIYVWRCLIPEYVLVSILGSASHGAYSWVLSHWSVCLCYRVKSRCCHDWSYIPLAVATPARWYLGLKILGGYMSTLMIPLRVCDGSQLEILRQQQ